MLHGKWVFVEKIGEGSMYMTFDFLLLINLFYIFNFNNLFFFFFFFIGYKAVDSKVTTEICCIKFLNSRQQYSHLQQIVEGIQSITSPIHIPRVLHFQSSSPTYLVEEYVDGFSLTDCPQMGNSLILVSSFFPYFLLRCFILFYFPFVLSNLISF
jgi:serine/threonine protein kinase